MILSDDAQSFPTLVLASQPDGTSFPFPPMLKIHLHQTWPLLVASLLFESTESVKPGKFMVPPANLDTKPKWESPNQSPSLAMLRLSKP